MPLLKRLVQVAAKVESTAGTAETLAASDVIGLAYDHDVSPTIETTDRPKQGSFGHEQAAVGMQSATVSFRMDFTGDGSGTSPVAFETLLPACGWVQSTDTFTPASESPGSNVKTLTIEVLENGRKKTIAGAAGTFVIVCESGKPIYVEWTFTGKWIGVTDAALYSATLPTNLPLRFANATTSFLGWSPCLESMRIDAGNNVILLPCQNSSDGSGFSYALVTDRKPLITINPEAALVATEDVYGDWKNMTEGAINLQWGDSTDTVDVDATAAQVIDVQPGDRDGVITDEITYQCNDDNLTIAFSATA